MDVNLSEEQLRTIGDETLMREYAFKRREGFDPSTCTIPERILQTESPSGFISHALLLEAHELFSRKLP